MSERPTYKCYLRYRRWIDRSFVHGLPSRRWHTLAAHLRTCASCRDRYDRLGRTSRALSPSPLPVDVIEQIGIRLAADVEPTPRRTWAWLGGLSMAVASAAALLLLFGPFAPAPERPAGPDDGTLRPRGHDGTHTWPAGTRQPGVRLFCINTRDPDAGVVDEARATAPALVMEPLRCDLQGELQLAYSTPEGADLWMVAFSRDSAGTLYWYAPRFAGETAVALDRDVVDEILPWTTQLAVRHNAGAHVLHILFFDRPVVAEDAAWGHVEPIHALEGRIEIDDVSTEIE